MANDTEVLLAAAASSGAIPSKTKSKTRSKKTTAKAAADAAGAGIKKPKKQVPAVVSHPPVSEMVFAAIRTLKERHGSSLHAIRKYMTTNYQCDVDKLSRFIKRALKNGVEKGTLVHTKGIGATGSFKLNKSESKKTPAGKKPNAEKKSRKKAATTTTTTQKKQPASGKKASVKKAAASPAVATKQKSTKPSKTAAKKPRAPKPKKTTDGQMVSPKK